MYITYKDLLNELNKLTPEQLDANVSLDVCGELYAVLAFKFAAKNNQVLDEGSPLLLADA